MIQTNYQLFDFLDFNPKLNEGDSLWRACRPVAIEERDGDVYIMVPFQKQNNSNEITPDLTEARKNYLLRLSAYGDKILRVSMEIGDEVMETSEMLQLDSRLRKLPLTYDKKQEEWIIDGNYGRTLEMRFKECDTVFFLDLPTNVCLAGVEGRIGSEREDMPWQEEELSAEFRNFIINFSRDEIPEINEMLRKYKNKNIIIFKSREEIDAWK